MRLMKVEPMIFELYQAAFSVFAQCRTERLSPTIYS